MSDEAYRIEIVQVGKMDEAPTCAVHALEKIGQCEPFCYTLLILRRIDPLSIRHVFITPWGPYNTGNISLFRHANLYVLKRGWAYMLGLEEDLPRLPDM
ncbi:MAG: hypothetical protein OXG49_02905 [Chloroflexi bacterium]|nr:hypothetical protein [Chloroflexota bacterium]